MRRRPVHLFFFSLSIIVFALRSPGVPAAGRNPGAPEAPVAADDVAGWLARSGMVAGNEPDGAWLSEVDSPYARLFLEHFVSPSTPNSD